MKDPLLKTYSGLVKQLWGEFSQIQLIQIPYEGNARADEISRLDPSNSKATIGILVEVLNQPNTVEEQEVMIIDAPNWRSPIIEYFKSPTIGTDSQSTKLRIRAARYTLIDEVLSKRFFTLPTFGV